MAQAPKGNGESITVVSGPATYAKRGKRFLRSGATCGGATQHEVNPSGAKRQALHNVVSPLTGLTDADEA